MFCKLTDVFGLIDKEWSVIDCRDIDVSGSFVIVFDEIDAIFKIKEQFKTTN